MVNKALGEEMGDVIVYGAECQVLPSIVEDDGRVVWWIDDWYWLVEEGRGLRNGGGCSSPGESA